MTNQQNLPNYELSKTKYLNRTNLTYKREGKTYVYVLFTNTGWNKIPSIPFQVGTAANISDELDNNSGIQWHNNTFNQPPIIHTIELLPHIAIPTYVQELKNFLTTKGFYLNPENPDSGEYSMLLMDIDEIKTYHTQTPTNTVQELNQFRKNWKNKYLLNEHKATNSGAIRRRLFQLLLKRNYPTHEARKLSLALASEFNPASNSTVLPFKHSVMKKHVRGLVKSLQGDWFVKGVLPDEGIDKVEFFLSEQLINLLYKR